MGVTKQGPNDSRVQRLSPRIELDCMWNQDRDRTEVLGHNTFYLDKFHTKYKKAI